MAFLIYIALLLAISVFGMLTWQMVSGNRLGRGNAGELSSQGGVSDREVEDIGIEAAARLEAFEAIQGRIRVHYPALARMLSGYLHVEALATKDGLEACVREMVLDWRSEKETVSGEISRLLAENPTEASVRAIIVSLCDAEFEEEGYRTWLVWLQGQFNDL